ncbi:uncharacterized protein LOC100832201 isoform X4 [Brachypodium distachyon]|uniref:uncharacterized protein LOC100832201 isoform X4 n=1 Tax=Brachypodium distachyon TaxID=15368 RepID=UPI000D0D26A2|nr:uncharacterized protein LOC100832201 isoform X4 [Brachypodium distachyon]|eukprot:XP_024312714.1 uncharacterized protein LOC100832201 isoform X4 [Brachypodium distachyon]
MFLTTVGHHKKNIHISFHFTRSDETVSRYFNQVLFAIGQLGPEMLRHRTSTYHPKFKAIHDLIPILRTALELLMEPMFHATFHHEWWEGSAHDSTVLRHSFEHPNGLRVLEGNNVVWQPQVVKEMLRYYKEKIQAEGRQLVFKETHHEECAKQINAKFSTNFTHRQVYHKFHKLKGQWKVILEAKSLSGANFDDVHKIILYDETEVVRMKNDKDKRAKYINVPISCFDEMESIFQDKHAMGEFTVPQTPFENTCAKDNDFIGDKSATNGEADPGTHYDSDCLPEESNNEGNSSKRATGGKRDKGKRVRRDDVVEDMTRSLRGMSETMRFHACHPPK